jgi:hypothetical protein
MKFDPWCNEQEPSSGALCEKDVDHAGPHVGWAHYPSQSVTWWSQSKTHDPQ